MPPQPTIGTSIADATCHTMRSATGLIAGPESPAKTRAMPGLRALTSIDIACSVLMTQRALAPASTTFRAIETMSVTFGVSFTMIGSVVARTQAAVTAAATSASCPNSMPPCCAFGLLTFNSMPAMPAIPSSASAQAAYSPTLLPRMLTMTGTFQRAQTGARSRSSLRMPMFCRPIELSMPAGVSSMRRAGLPARGCNVVVLLTIAPRRWMSINFA